jgi:hypothetical protein
MVKGKPPDRRRGRRIDAVVLGDVSVHTDGDGLALPG